jgi:hypothetical protein
MSVSPHSTTMAFEPASVEWWVLVIWGVASVVLGGLLLFSPVASALVLVAILAAFWLVGAVIEIIGAVVHRGGMWGWHLVSGAVGVVVALVVLGNPVLGTIATVSVLYLLVASSALFSGITGLFSGERSLGRIVLSIVQLVLGILLLTGFFDLLSLVALVQAIGLLAVCGGVAAAVTAFRLRHAQTAGA